MEAGRPFRFKQRLARPRIGDSFGELTVVGIEEGPDGGLRKVRVQCSCGAEPHPVDIQNLRAGRSTRCNKCSKKAANAALKQYHGYASIVPAVEHRRRLLNRIAACINRCTNPNDAGFHNYGARGIRVAWGRDRRAFLAYLVTLDGWDVPSLELDRIDVEKGYEPGNLRFVSHAENQNNKRKPRAMQERIGALTAENDDLRTRLRHLERWAEEQVHGVFD